MWDTDAARSCQELRASLDAAGIMVERRSPRKLEALRSAVDRGISGIDAGQGVDVAPGGVRDYLRARGRLATERADAKTA